MINTHANIQNLLYKYKLYNKVFVYIYHFDCDYIYGTILMQKKFVYINQKLTSKRFYGEISIQLIHLTNHLQEN